MAIGEKYNLTLIKQAIIQSKLNQEQIEAILIGSTLEAELISATTAELAQATATNALTASQTGATASTFGLGTAFKGLGLSIKTATKAMITWMATNPIGWITAVVSAIGASIYGVVKLHDALTVSLEEQKEKLQETKEAYESVKNELQEVETELENTQNKVEELENTPNLSWVEQEELDRLREVTKELELQKKLKQDAQLESAEDLYKENEKTFEKEFKSSYGNTSIADMKEQLAYGHIGTGQLDYENITDIVSALQYINEEKAKLTDESEIAEYENFINDLTDLVKSEGQEYLSSLSEYKQNILEIASIRDLTEDEQEFYDYLSSMQKAIYEYYSPATWNNLEFDSVFDTEGIEKTKEELVSMYKAGELSSADMLEQFPKLNQAIKESEIIAGEGSDAFKEFFNEIAALADGTADTVNDALSGTDTSISITQTIDQLNTQLKPAFDSLKSAYQDIFTTDDDGKPLFTLENVDLSMLDSLKSAIDDLNENEELGISIDYSSFETLVDVLTNSESTAEDVRNAINGLAGTIVQSLNPSLQSTTAETYQLTKSMLESLGVANAEEVMISALGYSLTELSALRKAASDAGFDLANATDNEISMFIWEQTESGNCAQELYALQLKKVLLNSTTINTSADIEYILGLANSAGIASNALVKLAEAKQMLDTANANGDVRGIYEAKKYANQLRDEIQNDVINFKVPEINFDGTDKSKSSKSGGSKSKSEKDLWLEEYKRKLEELKRQLNEGRLMPSSTVMWNK